VISRFISFVPGKACGVPRDGNIDKKEETELLWSNVVESQSAFLGPNLWDNKTIPYDNDLKVNYIFDFYRQYTQTVMV